MAQKGRSLRAGAFFHCIHTVSSLHWNGVPSWNTLSRSLNSSLEHYISKTARSLEKSRSRQHQLLVNSRAKLLTVSTGKRLPETFSEHRQELLLIIHTLNLDVCWGFNFHSVQCKFSHWQKYGELFGVNIFPSPLEEASWPSSIS